MTTNNEDQGSRPDPKHILAQIRKGYDQELSFKLGEWDVACRILSASEETNAISKGKIRADKAPESVDKKRNQSICVQKQVLLAGTTIGMDSYLPMEILDKMSGDELSKATDKYRSKVTLADPDFELLPLEEIDKMISAVKKKNATWRDFYISDLAAMGRYFLEQIRPKDSVPGS